MMVAYEFGDPTGQKIADLGPEMVGWWLAFFKYKNELENTPTKKRPNSATKSSGDRRGTTRRAES